MLKTKFVCMTADTSVLRATKLATLFLLFSAMSACTSLGLTQHNNQRFCAEDDGTFNDCNDLNVVEKIYEPQADGTDLSLNFNFVGEYTEQMASELRLDVRGKNIEHPIVVASFVYLDSNLQNTSTLGNQLAESFINDLQQLGLPVSDHKLMGVLNVTEKGDFVFSRKMEELYNPVDIGYVLTGTMIKNNHGVIINARLINFETNIVAASTSKMLPNIAVAGLL